jgi:hypothetical protein
MLYWCCVQISSCRSFELADSWYGSHRKAQVDVVRVYDPHPNGKLMEKAGYGAVLSRQNDNLTRRARAMICHAKILPDD